RVLLVEDEPDSAELFRRVLEGQGASVALALDAREALATLTDEPPDVLVADIGLPGEDGYDLLRRIRALPPQHGGDVPAAALTAYAGPVHAERAREAGYAVHLEKPVSPDVLVSAVASLARRS
ncbi:MAG TPA: response regulator, partial [Thermoanaerobaculia bacterium]|nr:response regulator [Thermoanaerobaculia bacterium]